MPRVSRRAARVVLSCLFVLSLSSLLHAAPLLKEGDRLVFLGDSITQQRIYTRYVMNFFALRYPDRAITFRNAGVSGDTAVGGIARLGDDVYKAKPDVVSICFGMNDAGYTGFEQERYEEYIAAMIVLVIELKKESIRTVLLTPGCVDPTRGADWLTGTSYEGETYNAVLQRYAEGVERLAADKALPVFDLHSLLLDVQTRAQADQPGFTMIPDAIHPSEPGQALMALGLLAALGCDEPASGLVIDCEAERASTDRCTVEQLAIDESEVSFVRRDDALPTYFDAEAYEISDYAPSMTQLNAYRLQVTGLKQGRWQLLVEGRDVGTFTAEELAGGVDLARRPGPWQELGEQVNDINADQERIYLQKRELSGVFSWVPMPPPEAEVERLALMKKLEEAADARDRQVRGLVADRTWHWSLQLLAEK